MTFAPSNLLIVGAGFSDNAGLPLASGFTKELLDTATLKARGPSVSQVNFIRKFVAEIFGEGSNRDAEDWPELEDIFTILDLSANTGHHLGLNYSASLLRVVRRAIIVRMIRMLSQAYKNGKKFPSAKWKALESFFKNFNDSDTAVLSMNWDTVFEQGMERTKKIEYVDYGGHARPLIFKEGAVAERVLRGDKVHILKPHGSVNWLYCDSCRYTFWVPPGNTEQVARTLFRKQDWDAVLKGSRPKSPRMLSPTCPHCGGESLGTRFATFSYRKALDFPMHAASWRAAEEYLSSAKNWVFIGYSMPAADFEFKHLLKRVQLIQKERAFITVITGGDASSAGATISRYRKFFGEVPGKRLFLTGGLDRCAMAHLRDIGVLT